MKFYYGVQYSFNIKNNIFRVIIMYCKKILYNKLIIHKKNK